MYILPPPAEYVILVANRKGLNCEFDIIFVFFLKIPRELAMSIVSTLYFGFPPCKLFFYSISDLLERFYSRVWIFSWNFGIFLSIGTYF